MATKVTLDKTRNRFGVKLATGPTGPTGPAGAAGADGADGARTFVTSATLSAAATTITVSGLDLATDEKYIIRFLLVSNTAATSTVSLYYNGDTTEANYRRETANRFTAGGGSDNAYISELRGSGDSIGWIEIQRDGSGYPRAISLTISGGVSNVFGSRTVHTRQSSTANVTSFTLSCSTSNGFAAGTKVEVFKEVAA